MQSQTWLGTRTVEIRRNTSKRCFDVLRSSDKVPTCRSPVGSGFTVCSDKQARSSDTAPHHLRMLLVN
jgi:hypothetical protein